MVVNPNNPNNTILGMLHALNQPQGVQAAQQPAPQAAPIVNLAPPQDEFVLADPEPPEDQVLSQLALQGDDNDDQDEPEPPLPPAPAVHPQPAPVNNLPPLQLGAGVINLNNQAPPLSPLNLMPQQHDAG